MQKWFEPSLFVKAQEKTKKKKEVLFARMARGELDKLNAIAAARGVTAAACVRIVILEWLSQSKDKPIKRAPIKEELKSALYVRAPVDVVDQVFDASDAHDMTMGDLIRAIVLGWIAEQG